MREPDPRSPAHYRMRAEEIRTILDGMRDLKARQMMTDIARDYDRLAASADVHRSMLERLAADYAAFADGGHDGDD